MKWINARPGRVVTVAERLGWMERPNHGLFWGGLRMNELQKELTRILEGKVPKRFRGPANKKMTYKEWYESRKLKSSPDKP